MKNDIIKNIERYVNTLLLPLENHYFHQFDHALEVKQRAWEIGKKEWLNEEEIEMVEIAALFHDTGFVIQYEQNEEIWSKIARNYLKSILYPENKITIIQRLILATKPEYRTPIDLLEEVIKDADLDNLWRDDFLDRWNDLKKEMEMIKKIKLKDPEWRHASLDFISNHSYFTKSQIKERESKRNENAQKLEKMIKDLEEEYK